jgi:hypothetical protein
LCTKSVEEGKIYGNPMTLWSVLIPQLFKMLNHFLFTESNNYLQCSSSPKEMQTDLQTRQENGEELSCQAEKLETKSKI